MNQYLQKVKVFRSILKSIFPIMKSVRDSRTARGDGILNARPAPYGYYRIKGRGHVYFADKNADIVKAVFDVFLKTASVKNVQEFLLEENALRMETHRVNQILRNNRYTQPCRKRNGPRDLSCEPIIGSDIFESAQNILNNAYLQTVVIPHDALTLSGFVKNRQTGKYYLKRQFGYGLKDGYDFQSAEYFDSLFQNYLASEFRISKHDRIIRWLKLVSPVARSFVTKHLVDVKAIEGNRVPSMKELQTLMLWKYFENEGNFLGFGGDLYKRIALKWECGSVGLRREIQSIAFPKGLIFDSYFRKLSHPQVIYDLKIDSIDITND